MVNKKELPVANIYPIYKSILQILFIAFVVFCSGCNTKSTDSGTGTEEIDWPVFMHQHDMTFDEFPAKWNEAPHFGNAMIGSMLYKEDSCIRLEVFRADDMIIGMIPMAGLHTVVRISGLAIFCFILKAALRHACGEKIYGTLK